MKLLFKINKDFPNHAGRPGMVGGSAPKGGSAGEDKSKPLFNKSKMNITTARIIKTKMTNIKNNIDDANLHQRQTIATNLAADADNFSEHPFLAKSMKAISSIIKYPNYNSNRETIHAGIDGILDQINSYISNRSKS